MEYKVGDTVQISVSGRYMGAVNEVIIDAIYPISTHKELQYTGHDSDNDKWAFEHHNIISKINNMEDNKNVVETTKERVLAAAAKFPESKPALKELYPDAFKDEPDYVFIGIPRHENGESNVGVSSRGELGNTYLYLPSAYDFKIVQNFGSNYLIGKKRI